MPQRKCCVSSCSSSCIDGAILHYFPNPSNDPERFHEWVIKAGLVGEDPNYIFRNRRICHIHFENIYNYPKNRLSRIAIPTLHLLDCTEDVHQMVVDDTPSSAQEMPMSTLVGGIYNTDCLVADDPVPMGVNDPESLAAKDDEPMVVNKPTISNKKTITGLQTMCLSKTEMNLYKAIAKTQAQLKRCQNSKASLSEKLKVAKKFYRSEAYKAVTKDLSQAAKIFFGMQTKQASKHPKGRRFTIDEKILALSLYKPSPKAYRLLSQICVLPKKSTLNKLMANMYLAPGVNDQIFDHLKNTVKKMPPSHKYCAVIFDEMAIASHLSYDKHNDIIKGFCNDGIETTKEFADHVLVFMVRGIFKKYKQPISFTFCAGTTKTLNLKRQIKHIIKKLLDIGLKIVCTTCDQGATNLAAINSLIDDTRAEYLKKEKEFKGGFFEIGDTPIYAIFDPPHLIKGIRNNLITKNLEFQLNGRKRTAKWAHIEALYNKGPGYRGVRLVPKLTARHAIPSLIPKMKVKYCTQVFSKTVSVSMGFTAETGRLPRECTDTADLLLFFDKLFDSVNGSYSRPIKGKIFRAALTPKSSHWKLWQSSLPVLKSMRFVGNNRRSALVPSISSWIKTIEAFQQLAKKLHTLGLRSLLLRNFNQDPLENFFGAIRAHGHANTMPSASAFETSYKALLVNNMISPKSVQGNCQSDDSYCLQNLKNFLLQKKYRELRTVTNEIDFEHLNMQLTDINLILNSEIPADVEKCAAAAYCCGWVINVLHKLVIKTCDVCNNDLEGDSEEAFSKFISLKNNSNKRILHYPKKRVLECFMQIEEITLKILKSNCHSSRIVDYIELVTTALIDINFCNCHEHQEKVKKMFLNKTVILIINDWCKDVNHILNGRNPMYDTSDNIKELAHNYYIKHKCRNKNK